MVVMDAITMYVSVVFGLACLVLAVLTMHAAVVPSKMWPSSRREIGKRVVLLILSLALILMGVTVIVYQGGGLWQ